MMRRLALALVVVGLGCRAPESPGKLLRDGGRELRLGNLNTALSLAERGLRALGNERGSERHWRLLLLKSEVLAATGKADLALKLLDGPAPSGPAAPELAARERMNRGYARLLLAEFQEAKRLLDEAHRMAEAVGSPALLAEVELRRGAAMARLYDPGAADASFRQALASATEAGDPYLKMSALGNLGSLRLFSDRYDEAVPWFEQVLTTARAGGYRRVEAKTLHNLGICYVNLGDLARAEKLLSAAEPLYAKLGDTPARGACLGDLGSVYERKRDFGSAITSLRKALDLARETRDLLYASTWLNNLATASLEAGDVAAAERYARQATEAAEKVGDRRRQVEPLLVKGRIAETLGQGAEAEAAFRRAIEGGFSLGAPGIVIEGHARLGSLYARTGSWKGAARQFELLSAAIEQNRNRLRREDWKLTYQSSIVPFFDDYVDLLMERGRTETALEVAESCRGRVLAEKLGGAGISGRPLTVAALRGKAAAAGDAVLFYWLGARRSFLWVLTRARVSAFTLPPEREIQRLVEAYTNSLVNLEDPIETRNPTGRLLYEKLIEPARSALPRGARVVVIPGGALCELNFETLLAGGDRPRYWIEDATVAVAPSLAALSEETGRLVERSRSLLLIGNPVSPLPEYGDLPYTQSEIAAIRGYFPAGAAFTYTGAAANPETYRAAEPGRFTFIHFSAHATANSESPLDSAVILSRRGDSYKLYARDVMEMPLRANLVTISACRGAGARLYGGEGLVGFAWAFLRAGARNVIAGRWDVNDRSAGVLMDRLYAEIVRGRSPAEALRAAKLALLGQPTYRLPYHWAPFSLFTRAGATGHL